MIYRKFRNYSLLGFSLALIAALMSGILPHASATGNHLDRTFDGNGKLATDFGDDNDIAYDVAFQTDGKIVVVGSTNLSDFAVARYNPNGALDTTFSGDGKTITTFDGNSGGANAVVIQSDGKIVAAGGVFVGSIKHFVLVRYDTNGSFDSTFGNGGMVLTTFGNSSGDTSEISDLAIQSNGKIVAVGAFDSDNNRNWAIARYNTNGAPDTTFSDDGKVTVDFGGDGGESATAVSILSDDKILAAGAGGTDLNFALARFNTDGSLDSSFGGGDGKVTTDFNNGSDRIYDMKVQPNGNIVAAGLSGGAAGSNTALARYQVNGTLDTTFDGDGLVTTSFSLSSDNANKIALQTDGKIVAVIHAGNSDVTLARYNANGSLDTSFGQAGMLSTDISSEAIDAAYSVAIQADGRLVAVGYTTGGSGNSNFAVVRYLPNFGNTQFDFDGDRKSDLSIYRASVGEWWYLKSSNGVNAAFQFGNSFDRIVPADFTGDGKNDAAVWRPSSGEWFILRSEDFSFYSFPFGTTGDIPAPADFDGDGKADASVFRPSTATWYISKSTGGTTIQQFGASGDLPVAADYDGDGLSDIAIFRPSSGQWWINRSRRGVIAFQFGSSTDKTVPGDYTGDGKTDVAIWRPNSGEWFVLRSENQSYYSFPFGVNGDVPASGDFDGDGKTDATVFRPSTSTWYSQRTTAGTLIQQFGVFGDKPVPSAFIQ